MEQKIIQVFALVLFTAVILIPSFTSAQYGSFIGIEGKYCAARFDDEKSQCCDGRIDSCAMPILNTLCYCDQFCNRTSNPDCCPDYWSACLGIERKEPEALFVCNHKGRIVHENKSIRDNCNVCNCKFGVISCEEEVPCLVNETMLNHVTENGITLGWSARNYSIFWGKKLNEGLKMMTGTLPPDRNTMRMHPINLHFKPEEIPRRFDSREQWPNLSEIRDQGWCGSSWAFSTIAVAQDRLTIASDGNENIDWSTQNLISCNIKGQQACDGGHIERAWAFLRKYGVVSEDCYPYVSGTEGKATRCKVPKKSATLQSIDCSRKEFPMERTELYSTEPAYRIASHEDDIKWELMNNGPVQAFMKVYQDFFLYGGGIYSSIRNSNEKYSTHSVRLLGWGEESDYYGNQVKYWLAANSWGTDWGEKGYFRIRRGTNESDIEQFIIAVRSRLSEEATLLTEKRNRFF